MPNNKSHKTLKIALIITILLIGGVTAWAAWVANHYKALIKDNLPNWVANATDDVYHVSLKDISINIITRRVTISGIRLWPDTVRVNELKESGKKTSITTLELEIPKVEINGIKWANIIANNEVGCGQVVLWNAEGVITQIPVLLDSAQKKVADSLKQRKKKAGVIKQFSVDEIRLVQSDIKFKSRTKDNDSFSFDMQRCNITLNDWLLKAGQKNDTSRFLFAKKGHVELDSFVYKKEGLLYNISTSKIDFETDKNSLVLNDLRIGPAVTKEAFYKAIGHQKEIYHLHFPSVAFVNMNWKKMINNNQLMADSVLLKDPNINVYLSRLLPPNKESKLGKYPHQLLHKLKLKTDIQCIKINNGKVAYEEVNDRTHREGDVKFEAVNGMVHNVTNIDSLVARNKICTIALHGKLYGKSDITATFKLLLPDTNGHFTMDGTLKNLDAEQITNTTKALALAEISSFHVSKMDMHVEGNQYEGSGNFTILYNDLKIILQKVDSSGEKRKLNDKPLISFLANNIVIYSDNPMKGDSVRSVSTYLKRDPQKSFFSLIWKNIFQGLEKTVVKNKQIEEMAKKKGKKEGFFKRLFGKKNK
ncbi:MAG: hypothetical protein JSS96_05195 [Bacteroidetes bacterium]|nr:hypothetical protein [Bacteroidota bacterium]